MSLEPPALVRRLILGCVLADWGPAGALGSDRPARHVDPAIPLPDAVACTCADLPLLEFDVPHVAWSLSEFINPKSPRHRLGPGGADAQGLLCAWPHRVEGQPGRICRHPQREAGAAEYVRQAGSDQVEPGASEVRADEVGTQAPAAHLPAEAGERSAAPHGVSRALPRRGVGLDDHNRGRRIRLRGVDGLARFGIRRRVGGRMRDWSRRGAQHLCRCRSPMLRRRARVPLLPATKRRHLDRPPRRRSRPCWP